MMLNVEQRGGIGMLHMTHGRANAMDTEFCAGLAAELERQREQDVQALVITGQGRIFSAGVDLLRLVEGGPSYLSGFLPALGRLFETLFSYPKPVVAAVNGHAIAGGCILACAADYRLMTQQKGRIGVPELLVGVPFPTIALEIMRNAVAPQHLANLLYSGETVAPAQAVEYGMIDELVESDALLERAIAAAERLASLPSRAFTLTKQQLRAPAIQRLREIGPQFDAIAQQLWEAPSTQEAVKAYVAQTLKQG